MSHELETRSPKQLADKYKRSTLEKIVSHTQELIVLYKQIGDDGVENAEANIMKFNEAINILVENEIRFLNKR